jgi:hypothetical protein
MNDSIYTTLNELTNIDAVSKEALDNRSCHLL